jgi:hypothetical protein
MKPDSLAAIKSAYLALLLLPADRRIDTKVQLALCGLREAIAAIELRPEEDVQNEWEALARTFRGENLPR